MDESTLTQLEASVRLNEAILNFLRLSVWTPAMGAMLVNGVQPVVGCTDVPSNAPKLGSPADLATQGQLSHARHVLERWNLVDDDEEDSPSSEVEPLEFLEWCEDASSFWTSHLEYFLVQYRVPTDDKPHVLPYDIAQHALQMARAVAAIKDSASIPKKKTRTVVTTASGVPDALTTEELADALGVQAQTIRKQHSATGAYLGIRPTKLANRRLMWPADAVNQVLDRSGKDID